MGTAPPQAPGGACPRPSVRLKHVGDTAAPPTLRGFWAGPGAPSFVASTGRSPDPSSWASALPQSPPVGEASPCSHGPQPPHASEPSGHTRLPSLLLSGARGGALTLCCPSTPHVGTGGHAQNLLELPFIFLSMKICGLYIGRHSWNVPTCRLSQLAPPSRVSPCWGVRPVWEALLSWPLATAAPCGPEQAGRPVASAQETVLSEVTGRGASRPPSPPDPAHLRV